MASRHASIRIGSKPQTTEPANHASSSTRHSPGCSEQSSASSFGWPAAPIAFTLIVLTACGVSMNKLAREWLPPNAATVAACAYILNPYALFVAYERTAYAELAAGIWLPLIILYALRDSEQMRAAPGLAGARFAEGPELTWVLFRKSPSPSP